MQYSYLICFFVAAQDLEQNDPQVKKDDISHHHLVRKLSGHHAALL